MPPTCSVTPLVDVIGSVYTGLDPSRDMGDRVMRSLISLLHERGVVVIKDQHRSDADYVRSGDDPHQQ